MQDICYIFLENIYILSIPIIPVPVIDPEKRTDEGKRFSEGNQYRRMDFARRRHCKSGN